MHRDHHHILNLRKVFIQKQLKPSKNRWTGMLRRRSGALDLPALSEPVTTYWKRQLMPVSWSMLFFFQAHLVMLGKKTKNRQLSSWERPKQCYRDLHLASHDSGVTKRGQCLFTPHAYIFMWTGPVALRVAVHHTQINYKCATLLRPVRSLSIKTA